MSIKLRAIRKSVGKEEIFSSLSLDVADGEFLVLKGDIKNTKLLLGILHGVEKVSSGLITISGYDIKTMKKKECTNLYQTAFGIVSQDFIDDFTVSDNISLPAKFAKMTNKAKISRIDTVSKKFEISDILKKKVKELKKDLFIRVMIARACFMNPKIILAYNPTKGLKDEEKKLFFELISGYAKKTRATIIFASNDSDVEKFATKTLTLRGGILE